MSELQRNLHKRKINELRIYILVLRDDMSTLTAFHSTYRCTECFDEYSEAKISMEAG